MPVLYVMSAAAAFFAPVKVLCLRQGIAGAEFLAKALASAAFLTAGAWLLAQKGASPYASAVFGGLCLGFAGDLLIDADRLRLPAKTVRPLQTGGALCFLAGHIAYACALARAVGFRAYAIPFYFAALFIVGAAVVNRAFRLSPRARIALFVYFFAAAVVVIQALKLYLSQRSPLGITALVGAVLFFCSDVLLGLRDRLPAVRGTTLARILPFLSLSLYYAAQLLFAAGLAFA